MLIMGVDPGTAITGYGLIKYAGNRFEMVDCGCIRTSAEEPLAGRLRIIYLGLQDLIRQYRPEQFAIEQLFINKNTRTALAVGHARGVAMLAASVAGLAVFEYTPLQVKQAVTGRGRAEKNQVQFMVKAILALPATPSPDDIADALALSICHANTFLSERMLK